MSDIEAVVLGWLIGIALFPLIYYLHARDFNRRNPRQIPSEEA